MKPEINIKKVMAISRKEFMDNVRNSWVLALSLIFLALTIIMSYFGGTLAQGAVGFQDFTGTVAGMSTIAGMLLPIIAIMLGYGAIISERENGSMGVVLGCPVSRNDVILGKFLGLGAVMLVTIFLGFGTSGIIIGSMAGFADSLQYLLFMVLTFLFSMFFLGFAILLSVMASKRSTAIAGGLVIWFSGMIAATVLMGFYALSGGDIAALTQAALSGSMPIMPDWYWAGEFFSFMDIYPIGSADLFGLTDFFGYEMNAPWFVNAPIIFSWFALLTGLTYLGSLYTFGKKDI